MPRYARVACALLVVTVLSACVGPKALAPVNSPPAVTARQRPLDAYDDRLLDALATVVGQDGLPSSERVVAVMSPKIELLFLAAGMASDWHLMSGNLPAAATALRASALEHVRAARQHDAVRHLGQLYRTGFWYDALPKLALAFSDPPALEQVYPIDSYLRGRSRAGEADLRDLMTRLRDFAVAADWETWWRAHEAEYAMVEEHCRMIYSSMDPLGQLEGYFGEHLSALVIIPSPMIACGFGGTIDDPLGSWGINCFGPATPGAPPDSSYLESIVLHEGGHAFVNHHAAEHPGLVSKYAKLYPRIQSEMQHQAYGTWETTLNEHVLRACHARIYLQRKGEAAAEQRLKYDEDRGFRYVRALYNKLAEYEADRARYPDFGSFYEQLLTALEGL